jgi:hypothetical protein
MADNMDVDDTPATGAKGKDKGKKDGKKRFEVKKVFMAQYIIIPSFFASDSIVL